MSVLVRAASVHEVVAYLDDHAKLREKISSGLLPLIELAKLFNFLQGDDGASPRRMRNDIQSYLTSQGVCIVGGACDGQHLNMLFGRFCSLPLDAGDLQSIVQNAAAADPRPRRALKVLRQPVPPTNSKTTST